ncbi:MAG: hypothetical protein COA99_06115 [Moraxellaceae bacterium]|nr:MAG: hypothetical protein COA99_06115 [Moraxellaceae bacterium]
MRTFYVSAFVAMILLINGCTVKFAYNQLDWLVPWYVSDYLEMDSKQGAFFDKRLKDYLDWHRRSQLPQYASFLRNVAKGVGDGLTEQEVAMYRSQTEKIARALVDRLAPDVIALFANATDTQLDALLHSLDDESERLREKSVEVTLQQQRQERVEDVIGAIERWTGSLTDKQEAQVAAWGVQYQPVEKEFYQSGVAWQAEFSQVLGMRGDFKPYSARFHRLLTTSDFGWSKTFEEKMQKNKQSLSQLYFDLDKSFTGKQRRRIIETLNEYADDFDQLAKQG